MIITFHNNIFASQITQRECHAGKGQCFSKRPSVLHIPLVGPINRLKWAFRQKTHGVFYFAHNGDKEDGERSWADGIRIEYQRFKTRYKISVLAMDEKKESLMSDVESERVQLYFSARKLADLDIVTVTDSFLMVTLSEPNKPKRNVLKTKIYWNDLNPDYAETVVLEFFFEIRQMLTIEVFHEASPPKLIGVVEASVGEIFGARKKGLAREIMDTRGKSRGTLMMKCEKVERGTNKYVEFDVRLNDIPSQGWLCFGGSSPMFRLYKIKDNTQYLLYESEVKSGTSPHFNRVVLNEKKLCNNNEGQPVILRAYNYSTFGAPKHLAQTTFTVNNLREGRTNYQILKDQRARGSASITNVKMYTKHEFSDYLMAGMEMALVICIDFTASNGSPSNKNSLHYTNGAIKSQYEQALNGVTNIVMDYDADKLVPTYGFGAKVRMPSFNTGIAVHHCFPINGNDDNPNLYQLEGIMNGYRECMKYLEFGGPTLFAPLLKEAMKECQQMKQEKKEYMILLIMTDGAIHDTEEVMDLLVKCGKLPLSVIIVGIGNGDWGLMHQLDDDDCQMTDFQGNKTQRDLVQFVEFSEHKNNGVELARQVLYELPRQVEEYHLLVGMTPDDYRHNQYHNDANSQMRKH